MTKEEHETNINYHYASGEVSFYTTRIGEKRNLVKRIGKENCTVKTHTLGGKTVAWDIRADPEHFRNPYMVSKP